VNIPPPPLCALFLDYGVSSLSNQSPHKCHKQNIPKIDMSLLQEKDATKLASS
jgi:hypothetical protein